MFEKKKKRGYGLSLLKKDKKKTQTYFNQSQQILKFTLSLFFSLLNILVMYLYLKLYQI